MKIKIAVVIAFVALLKVLAETYLPGFPISAELINTVIMSLLAFLGVQVVEALPGVRKLVDKMRSRNLW